MNRKFKDITLLWQVKSLSIHTAFYSTASCFTINITFFMKSWNMEVILKAVLTTFWCLLHGFPLFFCSVAVVETSDSGASISSASYVMGRRKIDVLLCSLYIQHRRGGNIFVSFSLSLHNRVHWYNNLLSWQISPVRSLWKLRSQSPGLIKCTVFNPFLILGKSTETLNIYSPSSEHRKVLFSHYAQNPAMSALDYADWPIHSFKRVYVPFKCTVALY